MEKKEKNLLDETLKLYGIPPQWVFSSRVNNETGEVVIVTNGGKKIKHMSGSPATCKLTEVEISGFLPKKELFLSERLNGRIATEELKKR